MLMFSLLQSALLYVSKFNHVVIHLLIYGDVGVEVDVDDDVDAGVISHVILSAAQAADRRVLMVSPQNAADPYQAGSPHQRHHDEGEGAHL